MSSPVTYSNLNTFYAVLATELQAGVTVKSYGIQLYEQSPSYPLCVSKFSLYSRVINDQFAQKVKADVEKIWNDFQDRGFITGFLRVSISYTRPDDASCVVKKIAFEGILRLKLLVFEPE